MKKTPRLASPCGLRGSDFERRPDGTLYCASCQEQVHDLTKATRREASRLYRANGGKLCGLVHVWPGGEIRFVSEGPRRGLMGAASGAALAVAMAGCDSSAPPQTDPTHVVEEPEGEETTLTPIVPPPEVETAPAPAPPIAPPPADQLASGDESPHRHVHETHSHRHPPVYVDDIPLPGGLDGL